MLNNEQVTFYNDEGYLIVNNAIDKMQIESIIDEYNSALSANYENWYQQKLVNINGKNLSFWDKIEIAKKNNIEWFQPLDISLPHEDINEETPFHFGPETFSLLTNPKILDVAESLLGSEITSNPIQHVRIKPPEKEVDKNEARAHITSTAWHQDRGVTLDEADQTNMITVWVAITDATIENGCLQVVPRAHHKMLPHCPQRQTAIADDFISSEKATALEVEAGSVIIIHPLTPHSSLPNISNEYRWSFDLRYNVTGQATGRSHFPEFIARSRSSPNKELRDWQEWKKMWEDCRYKLAHSPHIEQHRWQADSPYCA